MGFLPERLGERRAEMESWRQANAAVVFYEPTRRLEACLALLAEIYPEAVVSVGRELTKLHEEIITKDVAQAVSWAKDHQTLKGEATVMVALPRRSTETTGLTAAEVRAAAVLALSQGASVKDLLARYRDAGLSRTELYELLLEAKASSRPDSGSED